MTVFNPFRELEQIREEIDRVFNQGGNFNPWRLAFLPGQAARKYPLVNLYEKNDNYVVEALAPGVDPKGLDVSITGNVLTISGEKQRGHDEKEPERIHRNERAAGKFVKSIELPSEVEQENVSAEYKHGVLYVTLPKSEKAKPRNVEIQVAN